MRDQEAIEMMQRCSGEIKMLRKQIDVLAPKAEAYDVLSLTINTMARRPSQGAGEDLAWTLDRQVEKLKAALSAPSEKPSEVM